MLQPYVFMALLTLPILASYLLAKRNEPDRGYRRLAHYTAVGFLTGLFVPRFEKAIIAAGEQSVIKFLIIVFIGLLVISATDWLLKHIKWLREWSKKKEDLPISKWEYVLSMCGAA